MSDQISPESPYRFSKSLVKGLALLVEMNRSVNASASISDLVRATGQHRTTVKRLLETLRQAGYVEHDIATNLYRLTFQVQKLSYGYRDTTLVTETAWPYMRKLSRKIVWPCSLLAPEGDEMVVRVSTRPYSRLSFHPGMPGRRMPMLTTAAGRAYLAYASEAARQTVLDMLRWPQADAGRAFDAQFIRDMTDETRARGYATNFGEWTEEPRFSAYAAPIRNTDGEAMVTLNVVFLNAAGAQSGAKEQVLEALLSTAREIEQAYASGVRSMQTDID